MVEQRATRSKVSAEGILGVEEAMVRRTFMGTEEEEEVVVV